MHRLILQSATYRQSSQASPAVLSKDPGNRWYSRWKRLRLEAEVIRDSLLYVSGQLNLDRGGVSVFPAIPKELFQGSTGWTLNPREEDRRRRRIYIFARRNLRYPFLEVFDLPDNNLSCALRGRSTTAPQSLTLLNAPQVMEASRRTAAQLERDHSPEGPVMWIFWIRNRN